MKYLKISNKGLLDIRLVALMGGTTKTNNAYKIGQFGTGLKYTLAYLFRNNVDFKIYVGGEQVEITTTKETISGEVFEILYINGERTSITTKMGLDWQPWMIVRELYSNALDEGEASYSITEETEDPTEDRTSFFIELTPQFLEVYNNWTKYFIIDFVPMVETQNFAIHPQDGYLRIYKQGILIKEVQKKSLFNYDIKNASINELREYKGHVDADLTEVLFNLNDKKVIQYFIENCSEDHFEATMDYDWEWRGSFNDSWREAIGNARIIHKEAKNKLVGANPNADLSGTIEVPKKVFTALTKQFEGIGALRVVDKINEFYETHDQELEMKLKQALTILEETGYFFHPELTFVFGEFGDKSTLAKVNLDKKEVLISQKMKDKSLFDFCSMLVEENEHFQTGFDDETRAFQQHFIDLYTKSLLDRAGVKL